MDIISAVIVTVSDDILLFSQILILSLIANIKYSKSRCIISLIAAAAIGFIAEMTIHSVPNENPILSILLYFIRLPLFTLFTIDALSFKYALISLIIQFLCSIINSAVIAVLPDEPLFSYLSFMAIPLCLLVSVLLFRRKHDEAKCYLEKMTGMMPASEFMFNTGNYIADAILSEGHEAASADGITIDFSGSIPPTIDSTDLCILLSNSLNNAIEACQPISGSRTITICAAFQQGIFVLIMKNPTLHKGQAKDIFPQTTKSDKSSHGFGLENIRKVVCRYDGIVHTSIDNGWFTIDVSLKI